MYNEKLSTVIFLHLIINVYLNPIYKDVYTRSSIITLLIYLPQQLQIFLTRWKKNYFFFFYYNVNCFYAKITNILSTLKN